MSKYYIPTLNQLMSNQNGFVQTHFNPSGIKYIWNKKYDFEAFERIGKNNISILTSTITKSYYGEKHNKYISLELNNKDEITKYTSYDGSISGLHNENLIYQGKPLILYYYIPIMKDNNLVELIKITKSWDIRDKLYLKQIGKKYNLENEFKRFINKS